MIISNGKVISGDIVTRVTSKVYNVTRSVVSGVERFTLQAVGRGFAINELSQISILLPIGVTNTTETPVIYWNYVDPDTAQIFTGSLPIKRNNGSNLAIGDLYANTLYTFYRPNSPELRLTVNITSYDLLQNKPQIGGIEIQGSQTHDFYNLPSIEKGALNKLKHVNTDLISFNETQMNFGNNSYKFNILTNTRPGVTVNGVNQQLVYFEEYTTKTNSLQSQINNMSLPDYYKGQVNTLNQIDTTGARPSDFWYVLDLGEAYENVPGNATWNGSSLDIAPDFVFHPDGITIQLNESGRIEVVKTKNKLTYVNGDIDLEFDGSNQLNLTPDNMGVVKNDEDYQQLLLDVANKIDKFTIAENRLLISDGDGQIKDSGKLLSDIIFEISVNNVSPAGTNINLSALDIKLSDDTTVLETTILEKLDLNKLTSQEIKGNINYLIKPTVLGNNIALFNEIPTDYISFNQMALSAPQKEQVRENIEAGTSNFSGSYTDLEDKPQINGNTINGNMIVNEVTNDDLITYDFIYSGYIGPTLLTDCNIMVTHKRGLPILTNTDIDKLFDSNTPVTLADLEYYTVYMGATILIMVNYNIEANITLGQYNTDGWFTMIALNYGLISLSDSNNATMLHFLRVPGSLQYYPVYDYRYDFLSELPFKPTILSRTNPPIYKLDNPAIGYGGTGYQVNDFVIVGSFTWQVAIVDGSGAITGFKGINFDAEYSTDPAQSLVEVIGGSGSGAYVNIVTYYKPGDTTERGHFLNVPLEDPLVQKSYVDKYLGGLTITLIDEEV